MKINQIYNEDCLDTMSRMPGDFVDLVVTSPPYDSLRTYKGYSFNFESVAENLYRIVKPGGVVVWVVSDGTIKGGESGTSFYQALYFQEQGFLIHDTMIWQKPHFANPSSNRCHQVFEYMFVFAKGKPKTFNRIEDVPIKYGKPFGKASFRQKDGSIRGGEVKSWSKGKFGGRGNVWLMNTVGQERVGKRQEHPAAFPERLAHDHIITWSNSKELVYDPFMGSGTVAVSAIKTGREWIGSEISKEYCRLANQRINKV